jgi:hypothetical protein
MQRLRRFPVEREDANQAVAVGVGQRPQQNRVEQAECHRGEAEAQPEHRGNEEREQRAPRPLAKGSAQIIKCRHGLVAGLCSVQPLSAS